MPILEIFLNRLDLFFETIKNIKTVGAIKFTSNPAIQKMVEDGLVSQSKTVVEFGAGNGCITKGILNALPKDGQLMSFEINEKFCEEIRNTISDDRFTFVEDSAADIEKYLNKAGIDQVDTILSSIPLSLMPDEVSNQILKEAYRKLKPGGRFIQIQYSFLSKKGLEAVFDEVSNSLEPRNVPPAFIFLCKKK